MGIMTKRPRVALLVETSRAYGRGLLFGIAQYTRIHGHWAIFHQERSIDDLGPRWLKDWRGDGIIARIQNPKLIAMLQSFEIPVVDLRGLHQIDGIPLVETNDRVATEMAVEHLLERGFEHLAYCGFPMANYSQQRLEYFLQRLSKTGKTPHVFDSPDANRKLQTSTAVEQLGVLYEQDIARWLESLPKPVGVMACNDIRGQQVLNACREHGIPVPDDVAVVGVDNDEILCELSDPPLSSVEPDTERIGYEAAALLDRMMQGQSPRSMKTFIPPRWVVTRQSSDVLAMADRDVASAVRLIREQACNGLTVDQILAQVPLSRSTLERRFKKLIGRTPKAEILRVQMDRIKRLLTETDFSLARIADMVGIRHVEYLSAAFKQKEGIPPSRFRQLNRANDAG